MGEEERKNSEYKHGYDAGRDGTGGAYTAGVFVLGETETQKAGRHQGEKDRAKFGSRTSSRQSSSDNSSSNPSFSSTTASSNNSRSKSDRGSSASSIGSTWSAISSGKSGGAWGTFAIFLAVEFLAYAALRFAWQFNPVGGFRIESLGDLAASLIAFLVAILALIISLPLIIVGMLLGFDMLKM